jgi:hypothetical protein
MSGKLMRLLVAGILPSFFLSGYAGAAPVNYNESVSGDLVYGGRSDIPVLFSFDAGVNTISGRMTGSSPTSGNPPPTIIDVDGFQFSLGSNLRLDSVTVSFAFTGTPNSAFPPGACSVYQLYSTGPRTLLNYSKALSNYPNPCDQPTTPIVSSGGQLWTTSLPLTGGVYEVSNAMGTYLYGGGYIDYTYSFSVSAVPLPGALGLFGAGVSSLAVFFRRRRSAEG